MKLAFCLLIAAGVSDLVFVGASCGSADECDVQAAYCRVLDREGDSGGIQGYVSDLQNGDTTLQEIVLEMCESPEYERRFVTDKSSETVVENLFDAIFARDPDEGGLDHWTNELQTGGNTYREICENFVNSDEYERKFGSSNVPGGGRSGCGAGVEDSGGTDDQGSDNEGSDNQDPDTIMCTPCEWSKYDKWSDCTNICDGTKHRTRTCECPSSTASPSCDDGCSADGSSYSEEDIYTDWDDCNESDGEFFLENVALPSFYLSLYYDDIYTVRATNIESLRWRLQHCGKALVEETSNDFYCLERDDDDDNDNIYDVFLSRNCNGKKEQEWELKKSGNKSENKSEKYYVIQNKKEKCCIDVFHSGTEHDDGFTTVDCQVCDSENEDQLWKIIELDD